MQLCLDRVVVAIIGHWATSTIKKKRFISKHLTKYEARLKDLIILEAFRLFKVLREALALVLELT